MWARAASSLVLCLGALGALAGATGCAHYPVNAPLAGRPDPKSGYRFENLEASGKNTDDIFVCLAFSGGGVRASSFAYGVLQKLRDTKIRWKGQEKTLLDEVDCISSVSGGSFTAAYYGLFHERIFQDFKEKYLYAKLQGSLFNRLWYPSTWFRLPSPYFDRIDLAAEVYDDNIFEHKTFGDLVAAKQRPYILLNATNMANGQRFSFVQEEFDFIGSDLTSYPVARGVAASSAFPFLLSPITVMNLPHDRIEVDGVDDEDYEYNPKRYRRMRDLRAYAGKKEASYVHLMDGGLADNIGVAPLEEAYQRGFINALINLRRIKKLVFIVVNANAKGADEISDKESAPGLSDQAYKTATIAMDAHSYDSISGLQDLSSQLDKDIRVSKICEKRANTRVECARKQYACEPSAPSTTDASCSETPIAPLDEVSPRFIVVDFDGIKDEQVRAEFNSIETALEIERCKVDALIAWGGDILGKNRFFQDLLRDLNTP